MTRIRFIPAQVKTFPDERPDACKYCGGQILTQHGTAEKSVTDLYEDTVTVVRYRCSDCGRTFRHCPEGVDRSGQTQRMRGWAALAWALGLSLRSASHLLAAFGVSVSRMSVWRDVQEAGRNARGKHAGGARGQVRVMGADETAVRVKGVKKVVGVVTDAETGQVLGLDVLVERDADGFMEWLGDFVSDYGVEAMVTDDLNTYKPVVRRLGIDHQICIAHARKWAWNRLDGIDGWDWVKARIWRLLTDLPPDCDVELLRRGASASGARGSGRRRDSSPHARGTEREVEGAVMPSPAGGRPMDEQRGGAGDRQKQDKVQDGQGVQERRRDAERVWTDAVGMERPGRLGYVGAGRGVTPRRRLGELRPPKPAPK